MVKKKSKKAKRIYLIDRDFQLRYTLAAVGLALLTTVLTSITILYPLFVFEILRIPKFLPMPLLIGVSLALILNIGLIAFFGILVTHRIAGPMFSFVRAFRRVEMLDFSGSIKLRDNDDLRYLARNFNETLKALRQMVEKDLETVINLEKQLEEQKHDQAKKSLLQLKQEMMVRVSTSQKSES